MDLLLLEEFIASRAFGVWFARQIVDASLDVGECKDAQRSVTDATGESDLEVTFANGCGQCTRFLIENKVGGGLQPRQAERYRLRGTRYVSQGLCTRYYSVIVAPSRYFGTCTGTKDFLAAHCQHGPSPGAVLLYTHPSRQASRTYLTTCRAAKLCSLVAHGAEQRVAVDANLHHGAATHTRCLAHIPDSAGPRLIRHGGMQRARLLRRLQHSGDPCRGDDRLWLWAAAR